MANSLKQRNSFTLWMVVTVNALFFYGVLNANAISMDGLAAVFHQAQSLIPIGITGIIVAVLNALPSSDLKATLVFWRLKHALPGHRAFSVLAKKDSRINPQRLKAIFKGSLPVDPAEQNATWYKLYRTVREDVIVESSHKLFLLLRDYAALSVMFLIIFGPWALIAMADKGAAAVYAGIMLAQYLIVRQAAYNAGIRMVTNVMALKTAAAR
ncbi:MAG: hypothetical protein KGL39_32995 [Patescibacteria group bacterium]|nr:hypothetical protein [Patescibacteria group bacterium]